MQETFERVDAAEAWGLDGLWLGDIRFNPVCSVLSSPMALTGYLAGRVAGRVDPAPAFR